MQKITTIKNEKYNIIIGNNIISYSNDIISDNININKVKNIVIITDNTVYNLYYNSIVNSISNNKFNIIKFIVPESEIAKSHKYIIKIYDFLAENNICRNDLLIALGGGTISDITGFVASTYLRGVNYINIPTTLLSQVDASIGGKTAINTTYGKNIVGTFYNPKLIICDTNTLCSLPNEILKEGFAEIIKYAAIIDYNLFYILTKFNYKNDKSKLNNIINICINTKLNIVKSDPLDLRNRMILNFGHTIGHAIEKISDYKLSHGYCVAIGMSIITKLSEKYSISKTGTYENLKKCILNFGLPIDTEYENDLIVYNIKNDKKRINDNINIVLLSSIGNAKIFNFNIDIFSKFIKGDFNEQINY